MSELRELLGLRKVRAVADYQFGRGVGVQLFPDGVELTFSPRTGRVRHVYLEGRLLATVRPSDGLLALAIDGARRLLKHLPPPKMRVIVERGQLLVAEGRDVKARWVKYADPDIRPGDEVLVVDAADRLLAVGKAVLSGVEMLSFKVGLAVKVRRGVGREEAEPKGS
ncbi:MAG: pseudouridine synthase [Thermoprotei archaeon]|nr:MAG: pseudouridine synthase [Thermoprotei archaeon]